MQLDKLKHISHEEFEPLNWLPMTYRLKQFVNSIVLKYFNEQCPNYLSEIFIVATESNIQLKGSFQKLKCSFCKTNNSPFDLCYIGPTFWNKTLETLKCTNNLNTFKHNLKKHFLNQHFIFFELISIFNVTILIFLSLSIFSRLII